MQVMFSFNLRITKDRHSLCLRNRVGTSGWTDGQGGQFTSAAAKSHHHHHHQHHQFIILIIFIAIAITSITIINIIAIVVVTVSSSCCEQADGLICQKSLKS